MNKSSLYILQSANKILRDANKNKLNNLKTKLHKRYNFVANVKDITLIKKNQQIIPIIVFKDIQALNIDYDLCNSIIIAKYSNQFLKLHQIKPLDMLSFSAFLSIKSNKLIFNDIQHLRYVTYPDDYVLRRIVPIDLNTRIGYVLTMDKPPLTSKTGKIEYNYPTKQKNYIQQYLRWLKRK